VNISLVLKLYNSLTRKKEKFKPLHDDRITVYMCGPTVYDVMHIGHARTYSSWDILVRYLRYRYPDKKVIHVQNYTDVGHLTDDADEGQDKILERAKARKVEPMELVDYYTRLFEQVMMDLKINFPNISPRATGHISDMITFVQGLLEKGHAYETKKGIYFDVTTYPKYGELANLDLEAQQSGARIEVDELKRNPFDFALFIKAPEEHIMKWPTPWGWLGYPGWHIECSAMSMKYLGETLDIHGGGIDHLPIHHTNERAQSESLTGKQFVRYWLHANFMTLNGEKMSKSTGNYISAQDAINQIGKELLRYYLVSASHYRTLDDFTFSKLEQKREEFEKLLMTMANIESLLNKRKADQTEHYSPEAEKFKQHFILAMDDDLNTPKAMSVIFNFLNYLNSLLNKASKNGELLNQLAKDYQLFLELAKILQIEPLEKEEFDYLLDNLLELRQEARKNKDFEMADKIRDIILERGYKVEDKPWGSHVIRLPKKPELSKE
jgi:cysteinyl-tRNA synthetase